MALAYTSPDVSLSIRDNIVLLGSKAYYQLHGRSLNKTLVNQISVRDSQHSSGCTCLTLERFSSVQCCRYLQISGCSQQQDQQEARRAAVQVDEGEQNGEAGGRVEVVQPVAVDRVLVLGGRRGGLSRRWRGRRFAGGRRHRHGRLPPAGADTHTDHPDSNKFHFHHFKVYSVFFEDGLIK